MNTETQPPELEINQEMIDFIKQKSEEYKSKGLNEVDAATAAGADWTELEKQRDEQGAALWNEVTRKIDLAQLLDDQLRRALGAYKQMYDKKMMPSTIDFKLSLKARGLNELFKDYKGENKRLISEVALILEVSRNGVWTVFRQKLVRFTHVNEMRKADIWKRDLYEQMLHDVIGWGITQYVTVCKLREDQANEQRSQPQQ